MRARLAALAALAAILAAGLAAGGCGGGTGSGPKAVTVYVSAPLSGERAAAGRGIADGARLALSAAGGHVGSLRVRAVYEDDARNGRWSIVQTAANARRATEDSSAIGFIGDLDSGATRVSLAITNQAEMVQISPGSTAVDLTRLPPVGNVTPDRYRPSGKQTFARVVPDDDVQGRAAAVWAKRMGAKRVGSVNDGTDFGRILTDSFDREAARIGLGAGEGGGVDLDYYGGGPDGFARAARVLPPRPVIGSDALVTPALLRTASIAPARLFLTSPFLAPSLLPASGQRFLREYRRRYRHPADPAAAYGYESMALLLDAIRRAGSGGADRGSVIDQVLSTRDRHSILGTYSIDADGDTTLDAVSGYQVSDGLPVFPVKLTAPR